MFKDILDNDIDIDKEDDIDKKLDLIFKYKGAMTRNWSNPYHPDISARISLLYSGSTLVVDSNLRYDCVYKQFMKYISIKYPHVNPFETDIVLSSKFCPNCLREPDLCSDNIVILKRHHSIFGCDKLIFDYKCNLCLFMWTKSYLLEDTYESFDKKQYFCTFCSDNPYAD